MNKNIFRPFFNENTDILNFIKYNTIGKNKKEYFDYTASGLAFRQIENRIHDVLETYANTHSKEASNADKTTNYYERARINLAHNLELTDDFAILPSVDDVLGFIHISEISWGAHTGVIEQFKLGDTVKAKIIELNKDAKIFKLSIKRLSSDPWETVKEKYQKGQILEREIKEILDFALLVEMEENVEGMVHISEISYRRVNNLKEKFTVGEKIKFKILEFNEEKRRVSLSMKAILDDIWANIHDKYTLNQEVSGKVINIQEYGIFAELEDGLEVFIHRNDFSWEKEEHKEYKLGDIVNFRILKIDEKEKKISGGIKQLTQSPWKEMESMYKIGNKVKVSVENEIENGYIVKLTDRFSALIPKKELPENTTLAVGDTVEGIITEMHEKRKSVILSVKKISEMEEEKELKELLEIYGVKKEE